MILNKYQSIPIHLLIFFYPSINVRKTKIQTNNHFKASHSSGLMIPNILHFILGSTLAALAPIPLYAVCVQV